MKEFSASKQNLHPDASFEHTDRLVVEIVMGGTASEHTIDLTRVPIAGAFAIEADMAGLLRVLEPLRDWLENHGALTPGSGVLVRTLSDRLSPEDRAEEEAAPGRVVDRRELIAKLREPGMSPSGT